MKRATRMALPPAIASLEQAPFAIALGIAIESADSGVATVRMPFSPNLLNAGGPDVPIHGGAIAALIDIAACAAIWSLPETLRSATVSMTVNYLSPAMTTDLLAHARVRRHGKRLAHLTVEVHDAVGAPIADALVVYKIS